jgi:hypothetical protein
MTTFIINRIHSKRSESRHGRLTEVLEAGETWGISS